MDQTHRWRCAFVTSFVLGLVTLSHANRVHGQAGLRESLERLDVNENGRIEPDEITPLSRPYLERISRTRRIDLDESVEIGRLMDAARTHYSVQNGVYGRDVEPSNGGTVKPFGPEDDQPVVPEFGLPRITYPYTQDDLDFAERTMRSHDRNEDGFIDRREAERNRWTHRDPFADDLDKDDRLSRLELAHRYARRRLLDEASDELRRREWRIRSVERYQEREQRDDRGRREESWSRRGGMDYWLTAEMMERFDENRNGVLEAEEFEETGLSTVQIDVDRDGQITRDELFAHVQEQQELEKSYTEGIPGWFYELDTDRDGQIQMSEFATEWTEEKIVEFRTHDINNDGLVTAEELTQAIGSVGGSYKSNSAELIPPRKTIISEIEVTDDFEIRDLNVQLSITHTNNSQLEAYLTGPDGERVELFAGVGGSDDNFDQTIFDDQSREQIHRSRPPFRGSFQPHGKAKGENGLSEFNGKSAKGIWQLVIRATRSDRFGMLHSWSLIVQPVED